MPWSPGTPRTAAASPRCQLPAYGQEAPVSGMRQAAAAPEITAAASGTTASQRIAVVPVSWTAAVAGLPGSPGARPPGTLPDSQFDN